MDENRLVQAITGLTGELLATDLVSEFVKMRRDYATKTLERASPGKFVETFVQCLQYIATGNHESDPKVDNYLTKKVEQSTALPDGLRLCGSRIARSMYTLRNKRSIAHKGEVNPNTYDLAFLYQGASWIMAEIIRSSSNITMEEAGALVELVQAPVGTLVEEIEGIRLVHVKASVRVKILVLLRHCYPDYMMVVDIQRSVNGLSAKSLRSRISELKNSNLIFGNQKTGYRLTNPGYVVAVEKIESLL